jgi:hypothetical protein
LLYIFCPAWWVPFGSTHMPSLMPWRCF